MSELIKPDWTDPDSKVGHHFTVHEALWLPTWKRMANEEADGLDEEAKSALLLLFQKMDEVRDFFGAPIIPHVTFRPWRYNREIGGATQSAHVARAIWENGVKFLIAACDFHVGGISCDEAKRKILDAQLLQKLELRMEDNGKGAGWLHLDTRPTDGHRFFKP